MAQCHQTRGFIGLPSHALHGSIKVDKGTLVLRPKCFAAEANSLHQCICQFGCNSSRDCVSKLNRAGKPFLLNASLAVAECTLKDLGLINWSKLEGFSRSDRGEDMVASMEAN